MTRRGAPAGNQNARKHGFYSQALKEAQRIDLDEAQDIEGLDDEVAVLRVKLKELLEHAPENVPLQLETARTLARLVQLQYKLGSKDKSSLTDAITDLITNVGGPLGILKEGVQTALGLKDLMKQENQDPSPDPPAR